jgi:hypothetical protein
MDGVKLNRLHVLIPDRMMIMTMMTMVTTCDVGRNNFIGL